VPGTTSPKALLLGLLRVSPRPLAVRQLVAIGALFGLGGGAVRVALTRLVAAGLVASDERGSYRLAAEADPVSRWADGWRAGERRLRAWTGAWLCVWHPRGGERGERARSHRALARLGLGEGRDGLWLRPDNLRARTAEIAAQLDQLGLAPGAVLFAARDFPAEVVSGWVGGLWPIRSIADRQVRALRDIERSRTRLAGLARKRALAETFLVGGAAIRALVRDPLLPDEVASGQHRRELTEAMLDYDRRGRAVWSQALELASTGLDGAPTHPDALDASP
jgi:phenylacetic acid degradation operon negative regulatory protein